MAIIRVSGKSQDFPSQKINALRKAGQIEEAYTLGVATVAADPTERWNIGALGWCLIDLVKRYADEPNSGEFRRYMQELADLPVQSTDEVLYSQRERWLSLGDAAGREAERARKVGKQGNHEEAVTIFARLADQKELRMGDRSSFGWELCHAIQDIIKAGTGPNLSGTPIGKARNHLHSYFKLGLTGPDLLHSRIAQQAMSLAKAGHIKIVPFAKMWNLDTFRKEDHDRFRTDGGKNLPSLSESFVNFVAKEAATNGTLAEIETILPQIAAVSTRFPDNPWLKMNRVKLLIRTNRTAEAQQLAVEFVRAKSREFWAWDLLGDVLDDKATKLACYAKALLCPADDVFMGKVRLKFAQGIADGHPSEARAEVDRIISVSQQAGNRISPKVDELTHQSWYLNTSPQPVDSSFYEKFTQLADDYLFSQLPTRLAVIDHVNHDRKLFHYIVDKETEGVSPFKTFSRLPMEGLVVKVRVDTIKGPEGRRTSLLSIEETEDQLPAHLGKHFQGEVRVNNGVGFVSDNIFIPAQLIAAGQINDGDEVSGVALINFDRKKGRWGLKALRVER